MTSHAAEHVAEIKDCGGLSQVLMLRRTGRKLFC